MDELDEFNEAPHSLRSETSSMHDLPPDDDDDDEDDQSQNINILDRTQPGRIETNVLINTDILVTDNDLGLSNENLLTGKTAQSHHFDQLLLDTDTNSGANCSEGENNNSSHQTNFINTNGDSEWFSVSNSSSPTDVIMKSNKLRNTANSHVV